MNLTIGNFIEITEEDNSNVHRVCGELLDKEGRVTAVALIKFHADTEPELFTIKEVENNIDRAGWLVLSDEKETELDLKSGYVRSDQEVAPERRESFRKAMASNLQLIQPVLDLGWDALLSGERSLKLSEICEGFMDGKAKSKPWIKKLLRRYWRACGNVYALGPQHYRSGVMTRRARLDALKDDTSPSPQRRPGRAVSIEVDFGDGSRTDRGGCDLPLRAIPVIDKLARNYLKDPSKQAIIRINRKRWKGLPWTGITKAITRDLQDYPAYAHLRPTRRQIKNLVGPTIDPVEVVRRSRGNRHANLTVRELNGDYRDVATYAGERYECDPYLADIHLVDDMTGLPIGRVNVYLIVDTFSGMVVGLYVTLDDINFAHISRALHTAFSSKVDWCQNFGLIIEAKDWPCQGLPTGLAFDNAQVLNNVASRLPELIKTGIARPFRGDDKGSVEINCGLTQLGHIYLYGFGVTQGPKLRCTDDPAKEARITVSTFVRELTRWIVFTHNHRALPKNRVIPVDFLKTKKMITPYNLWCWSISRRGGKLRRYKPELMMPRLLASDKAKITRRGLEINGLVYDLPKDMTLLRSQSACSKLDHVLVGYDELSTNQIYLIPKDRKAPPTLCPLSHYSRDSLDLSWHEKEQRAKYVSAIHKLTVDQEGKRETKTSEYQEAALAADLAHLPEVYGTNKKRMSIANQIDIEEVAKHQIDRDNLLQEKLIHVGAPTVPPQPASTLPSGAPPNSDQPEEPTSPSQFD